MPKNNRFQHQQYPPVPAISPTFYHLQQHSADDFDFSRLHTELGVSNVIVVHGTFLGDDPFAIAEILRSIGGSSKLLGKPLNALADQMQKRLKPFTDRLAADVGNYTNAFVEQFQSLVGDDPHVERLHPTWTGQNHHLARADLAVRLLCRVADASPADNEVVLLWGHSHAGNGFALLSNLLANDRTTVNQFFEAAGNPHDSHWFRARDILASAPGPHPLAKSVCFAAFGTPVRYGWDPNGYRSLVHILHQRNADNSKRTVAEPVFPFQSLPDLLTARHGDWVQTFAVAGTDVAPPTSKEQNERLKQLLERSLEKPDFPGPELLRPPERIANALAWWKTGTRCHADGHNLLVDYEPSGRKTSLGPIENSLFGHGVATTVDWLPSHLALVIEATNQDRRNPH